MKSNTGSERVDETNSASSTEERSGASGFDSESDAVTRSPLNQSSARALIAETTNFAQGFRLTPRESEIVVVLAEGVTRIKDIAQRLKLSPNTVNNHVNSIFMKTKARSKSQLLAMLLGRLSVELQSSRLFRQSPRVALLSSDSQLRTSLAAVMKESNISVELFDSQREFIHALGKIQPHFVVADLSVADLQAIELLDKLAAHGAVHAAFVGKSETIATRSQAMNFGAMDLFEANSAPSHLINTLLIHYIEDDADRARFLNGVVGEKVETVEAKEIIRVSQSTLGRGGIFLSSQEVARGFAKALVVGNQLNLRLSIDGVDHPFHAQGEVVWVQTDGAENSGGAGVRLLHLIDASERERKSWREVMRRNSARSYIPTGVPAVVSAVVPNPA